MNKIDAWKELRMTKGFNKRTMRCALAGNTFPLYFNCQFTERFKWNNAAD